MNRNIRNVCLMLASLIILVSLAACSFEPGKTDESSSNNVSSDSPSATESTQKPEDSESETEKESETETETEAETEPEPETISLKIGSYNIANGSVVKHDISKLGEDIKNQGLDIVGVQEVDHFANRSGKIDTMKLLSESSGLQYYTFFKAISIAGGYYGLGVLSKYPIVEKESTRLYSGTEEQRIVAKAVIDINGTSINFFVTHLSYEAKSLRDKQFEKIASLTAECDNFIVVGDFNTADFTEYTPIKNSGMVNNPSYKVITFPSSSSSIDNIVFSSSTWTFDKPKVLANGHSDHNLLYATGTFTIQADKN